MAIAVPRLDTSSPWSKPVAAEPLGPHHQQHHPRPVVQHEDPDAPIVLPQWKDIPPVVGMPHGCAWGLFDRSKGTKDELGTLNLLIPSNTKAALSEILTGERIQLDWSLDNVTFPAFGRKPFAHDRVDLCGHGVTGNDDIVTINTQSGSQWDGLRHIAHQASKTYYNGLTHDQIVNGDLRNGTDKWVEKGGIAARAVLVDWVRWHELTRPHVPLPSPVATHGIPLSDILDTLAFQGTDVRPADLLLVRTGFVRWHENASNPEKRAGTQEKSAYLGLSNSDDMVEWLWNNHFSAVAGDSVTFEAWPARPQSYWLHERLLAHWGTPIGEMWNLEALSDACCKRGKWSFFLTSAPLHIKGGVGSPPNAIAIL